MGYSDIKGVLKRNAFLYWLNAAIKSAQLRKHSEACARRYRELGGAIAYDPALIPSEVRRKLQLRGISIGSKESLRILWVGTNWDQDNSGFLQALNRVGQVINFTNSRGSYGLEFGANEFDREVAICNGEALLRQVEDVEKDIGKIDLLIGQMLENYLPVEYLEAVQARSIATVNIAMDDRLPQLWESVEGRLQGAAGLVAGVDLTLTTSPECCLRYAFHGGASIFWPLGSDPDLFVPQPHKDIDVSFVGNNYGKRGAIVARLQAAGISVEAFGQGWPNGRVSAAQAAGIFGRSKIILGMGTIGYSDELFTLKLRDFDAPMSGALYITHRNPDLLDLFDEGKEIATYGTPAEAVEKIAYYLGFPDTLREIGAAAARKSRSLYTWDARIAELLSVLDFLPRQSSAENTGEQETLQIT